MRRVVVTGLGVVSPLGRGVEHNWEALIAGKSGIRPTQGMDLKDIPVTISGQVPFGESEPDFNPDTVIAPKDQKKNDKFIILWKRKGIRRRIDVRAFCGKAYAKAAPVTDLYIHDDVDARESQLHGNDGAPRGVYSSGFAQV